jgi:hypothetical protein
VLAPASGFVEGLQEQWHSMLLAQVRRAGLAQLELPVLEFD